ncbi:MAG TPA: GPW/gp25 family protein [Gammaproteobacteria bacterium]|nr:GPW/gp25 family protein [Gammaproteobacteria bacterium]
MSTKARLGRGWDARLAPQRAAPDGGGSLAYADGPEKVRQSMLIILDTEPGERVMRPTFGCGLRRYLMKPNTTATRALIQHDVERALSTWEPRITLERITVDPGDDAAMVLIQVAYVHERTGRKDNLVYPFYLQ